jgi:hypothetical protein
MNTTCLNLQYFLLPTISQSIVILQSGKLAHQVKKSKNDRWGAALIEEVLLDAILQANVLCLQNV